MCILSSPGNQAVRQAGSRAGRQSGSRAGSLRRSRAQAVQAVSINGPGGHSPPCDVFENLFGSKNLVDLGADGF